MDLDPTMLQYTLNHHYDSRACSKCTLYGHLAASCEQLDMYKQDLKQMLRKRAFDEYHGRGYSTINNLSNTNSQSISNQSTIPTSTAPTTHGSPSTSQSQSNSSTSNIQMVSNNGQSSSHGTFSNSSLTRSALRSNRGGFA